MNNCILIADSQQLFKESLVNLIDNEIDENYTCQNYCTYKDLKQGIVEFNNDIKLVIVSTNLKDIGNTKWAISNLKTLTTTPILVITSINSQFFAEEIIHSGAVACMIKTISHENCKETIKSILIGEKCLKINELDYKKNHYSLTHRQYEVLSEISQGLLNKEISAKLKISESTVKIHISSILSKLSVNNRTEAAVKFFYEA